jgi:hypothetical protein
MCGGSAARPCLAPWITACQFRPALAAVMEGVLAVMADLVPAIRPGSSFVDGRNAVPSRRGLEFGRLENALVHGHARDQAGAFTETVPSSGALY